MEVWEYHEGASGFGTTGSPLTTLITSVAGAFGGVSGAGGESGLIYTGVNSAVTAFGTGGNQGDARPAAYLNYILFDKNFKVLDAGWQLAPATTFTKQKLSFPTKDIKEEGYLYTWLSYDDASNNYVYFDDFKVTHTKSNVIQYNEYYPFGLQTSNSWTRENAKDNNYLYNAANELSKTSGWYEMFYRGYDPATGRMLQIDPYAAMYASSTTYNYAMNNPVMMNDPSGGQVSVAGYTDGQLRAMYRIDRMNYSDFGAWAVDNLDFSNDKDRMVDGGSGYSYGLNEDGKFGRWTLIDNSFEYGLVTDGVFEADGTIEIYEWKEFKQQGDPVEPWYVGAWSSFKWHLADAIGLHSDIVKRGAGVVIIGVNGQKVQIDYSQKNAGKKIVGILDLNDNSNILSVLSMLVISNELDAISTFVNIRNQDPRNRYDENGNLYYIPIPGYPGYYEPGPSTLSDNYYYKYPNVAFKYVRDGSDHLMIEVIHPRIQNKSK